MRPEKAGIERAELCVANWLFNLHVLRLVTYILIRFLWDTIDSSHENMRNRFETIRINDRENEPGHIRRLEEALGIINDNIWHHEIS